MKKWSAAECEMHVMEWEVSGLSKAAYCRQHEIPEKRFYYWCDLYAERQMATTPMKSLPIEAEETKTLFAKLMADPVDPVSVEHLSCDIVMPSGVTLKLDSLPSTQAIVDLVRELHAI